MRPFKAQVIRIIDEFLEKRVPDERPLSIRQAEKYVESHKAEFSEVSPEIRIQRALYLRATGQIQFDK